MFNSMMQGIGQHMGEGFSGPSIYYFELSKLFHSQKRKLTREIMSAYWNNLHKDDKDILNKMAHHLVKTPSLMKKWKSEQKKFKAGKGSRTDLFKKLFEQVVKSTDKSNFEEFKQEIFVKNIDLDAESFFLVPSEEQMDGKYEELPYEEPEEEMREEGRHVVPGIIHPPNLKAQELKTVIDDWYEATMKTNEMSDKALQLGQRALLQLQQF